MGLVRRLRTYDYEEVIRRSTSVVEQANELGRLFEHDWFYNWYFNKEKSHKPSRVGRLYVTESLHKTVEMYGNVLLGNAVIEAGDNVGKSFNPWNLIKVTDDLERIAMSIPDSLNVDIAIFKSEGGIFEPFIICKEFYENGCSVHFGGVRDIEIGNGQIKINGQDVPYVNSGPRPR